MVALLLGSVGAHRHYGPGDQKSRYQHKVGQRDEQGHARPEPAAAQADGGALQAVASVEQGGLHTTRRGVAVVIPKVDVCVVDTWHGADSDTRPARKANIEA